MAWKKDLEKLKHTLGAEEPSPRKPAPPPKPKPSGPKPIEEEDAMFLSAMGQRPRQAAVPVVPDQAGSAQAGSAQAGSAQAGSAQAGSAQAGSAQAGSAQAGSAQAAPARPEPPPQTPGAEFASAMGDLKGLVALRPVAPPPPPVPAPPPPVVVAAPAPAVVEAPPPAPAPAPQPLQPVQINLAAGMAIDVDASLDLKGHGRLDAEERLKERIMDGQVLGWRTLHVVLGPSEELRQMVLDLLASPAGARLARFAQAPIPMGGSQAWILYFRTAVPPAEGN